MKNSRKMQQYVDLNKLEVGDSFPAVTKVPITKVQLVRYAGASGDFNPIHTDDDEAQRLGLKGVIAQGPLIMGFVGQAIARWVPKRELKRFRLRFRGMSYPGDVITINATVAEKEETENGIRIVCNAMAENQNREIKASGEFEVLGPWKEG